MILTLEFPPTANTYYRRAGHTIHISERGRHYKRDVASRVRMQLGAIAPLSGDLSVSIEASPPDNRRRDLDNIFKPLLDALTAAGVWGDDSQVKRIIAEMRPKVAGGKCVVAITEI